MAKTPALTDYVRMSIPRLREMLDHLHRTGNVFFCNGVLFEYDSLKGVLKGTAWNLEIPIHEESGITALFNPKYHSVCIENIQGISIGDKVTVHLVAYHQTKIFIHPDENGNLPEGYEILKVGD